MKEVSEYTLNLRKSRSVKIVIYMPKKIKKDAELIIRIANVFTDIKKSKKNR